MRRLIATLLVMVGASRAAGAQGAPTAPGRNLLVRVQTVVGQVPLGYSVVALPTLGIERFTGANGTIVIAVPNAGTQRLVVKRLGFTPKDTVITVSDAPSQSVTIQLARVSFQLKAVRVVAWPPCRRPGLRRADREIRGIVDQIRQNAERYRLLTRVYPFTYLMEAEFGRRLPDGSFALDSRRMITVNSDPGWTYRPGNLVGRAPGNGDWMMRIPSIGDLAEDEFVDNHCFHVAGLEDKDGVRLLRIDIVAWERLRDVDANVVVWLDPADYQLRHATYTLSKAPKQVAGLIRSTTSARYHELIPFVPVLSGLVAQSTWREGSAILTTMVLIERQTNKGVTYTDTRPDALARDSLPHAVPDR